MSAEEDVLRLDPSMRIAREIGKQAGIDPEQMKEWYEQVCLGEIHVAEFFLRVEARIKDPQLLETFRTLRIFRTVTGEVVPSSTAPAQPARDTS